jgi:uncharacterized SAM-binding protein YcdF (DUF218 family)
MPRARWAFVNAGVDAVPAPMAFTTLSPGDRRAFAYVPSTRGLRLSALALRERLGLAWYKYRHDTGAIAPPAEKKKPATSPGP